jgi:hypothetical protein
MSRVMLGKLKAIKYSNINCVLLYVLAFSYFKMKLLHKLQITIIHSIDCSIIIIYNPGLVQ